MKVPAKLVLLFFFLLSSSSVFGSEQYSTSSAVVSATVISSSINAPNLIAPKDASVTKNTREPLVWSRPSPLPVTPLHHYDVYLDNLLFAASISDSITTINYYNYSVSRLGDTFYLNFNTDLSQGYHSWRVVVYDSSGTSAGTGTWTYYIDPSPPDITLKKVDKQVLNWTTKDLSTIPDDSHRSLTVTTSNPVLTGWVEPYANLQIIMMCPQNILNCENQIYLGNYPQGDWQHRFYNLTQGLTYTVYLSATDAGGNSVIFPEFYLTFGQIAITPAITVPFPTGLEPIPTLPEEIITAPTMFSPAPPLAPTPPIYLTATSVTPKLKIENWLSIIIVFGLLLHLIMTLYGTKTRLNNTLKMIFVLLYPFFGKKEYQTHPFTSIEIYDPDKLDSPLRQTMSNVKGFFHLATQTPEKIFVKLITTGRVWKNTIIPSWLLSKSCLYSIQTDTQMALDRHQINSLKYRSLPLTIASLTSIVALITTQKYLYLVYLYLTLQLLYSEYLYPSQK